MKLLRTTILLSALLAAALLAIAGEASAYTVNLIYFNTRALADELGISLQPNDIIQLIYSPDEVRDPPNLYNGRPTGDDILWETTGIDGPGPGQFLDLFQYDSALSGTGHVYVRFFNASNMSLVSYYGMSPLHTLSDLFGFDIWDITQGGLYLWTEYPFMVIPEPETWLTLLPALLLGMYLYGRSRKKPVRPS